VSDQTIIYCDESGNSGANYLDCEQPLYVLAGWAVAKDAVVNASVLVERIRQVFCPQRKELKAAAFLNNEQGKTRAAEFIRELGSAGCVPLIVVAEKRYVVTGKIVETFLDPAFNKKLHNGFTTDILTKRELANTFLTRLPPEVIDHFAQAYRNPSSEAFLSSVNDIATAAKSLVNPELAACIEGCLPEIRTIAESEDPRMSAIGKISQSVNAPALMAFFLLVQNLARLGAIEPLKVVHDEQSVFEKDMQEIFRLHREAKDFVVEIPNSYVPYSSFSHIPKFELARSVDCQMIQAADVLAGTVNHLMKLPLAGHKPSPGDMELAGLTLPSFFLTEPPIGWLIASENLQNELLKTFILPSVGQEQVVVGKTSQSHPVSNDTAMFPVVGEKRDQTKSTRQTYRWDLPVYGILGEKSGALMLVNAGNFELEGTTYGGVLPLFTSREKAIALLSMWPTDELTEPQGVMEFGPKELPHLVNLLKQASEAVKILVIDPGPNEEDKKFLALEGVIAGMGGMLSRIERLFSSGFDKVMIQRHDICGIQAMTMLTSKGDYGALLPPNGRIYWGETRHLALEALIAGEGLRSP